ncbi:unnamed protein product [Cyclocybe aegerita]|uniref:Uncharacterized protein n=1 Tax=Cyclocybe aegerita TaxID=1973307 RepID=A0A8S0VYT5_CYCAE|nr:unnamed protein product [Cyclocybe aegerita]
MPSHSIPSGLVKLYFAGAPWKFSAWQDITDICHGLFLEDDSQLPEGWTQQTATQIAKYFDLYNAKLTKDTKIKFVCQKKDVTVPGHAKMMTNMTEELDCLMEGLGIPHEELAKRKSAKSTEDVSNIVNLYHDYFKAVPVDDGPIIDTEDRPISVSFAGLVAALAANLSFKDGLPILFNCL